MPLPHRPRATRFCLIVLVGAVLLAGCRDERRRFDGTHLVLEGVTVIDGTGRPPQPGQAVVLQGNCTVAVGKVGDFVVADETEVIELAGRYLLPGFIDMHAHVTILPANNGRRVPHYDRAVSEQVLRTLLAFGITTVRNPAAPTADGVELREAVAGGEVIGPRIFTAGSALDRGTRAFGPFVAVTTEEAVREEVRRQAEAGVDFVKVYAALPPRMVEVAVEEAHAHGLRVIGHMQRTTWTQAARFGIDALTHGAPWSPAYLPEEKRAGYPPSMQGRIYWLEHLDLDGPQIDSMLTALAEHHVTIDPTLIAYHTKFWGDDPRYLNHPDSSLVPEMIRDGWQQGAFTPDWTEEDYRRAKAAWPTVLGLTKRLFDRGVLLTAGSDLPNPWVIPGVSFHEELQLLADAGIPPLDVLKIATINGAVALGIDEEVGTVEPGKRADLVVLRANPLDDIRHTRSIEWIIQGGTFLKPDSLLSE